MTVEWREDRTWHLQVEEACRELLEQRIGPAILADARDIVPIDKGNLKKSLRVGMVGDDTVRIGCDPTDLPEERDYSLYVELGTSRAKAQPYLRPALYRQRGVS